MKQFSRKTNLSPCGVVLTCSIISFRKYIHIRIKLALRKMAICEILKNTFREVYYSSGAQLPILLIINTTTPPIAVIKLELFHMTKTAMHI
jgi:hypothetical protein